MGEKTLTCMQNDSEATAKVLEITQHIVNMREQYSSLALIRLGTHYSAPPPSQLRK